MGGTTQGGTPSAYLGNQGWYDNTIWAGDPNDQNLVIVGGLNIWKSSDGGDSLIDISNWRKTPKSVHADQHAIVSHPDYDNISDTNKSGTNKSGTKTVFVANDGGIYRADDITTAGMDDNWANGWTHLNAAYGVTQFYGIALSPKSNMLIGGTQDNGTLRLPRGGAPNQWAEMFGGDGGFTAADPEDSKILYGEYTFLNLHRSTDGGFSSEYISGQYSMKGSSNTIWKARGLRIEDAMSEKSANFIAPFALDPNNRNRILAGGLSLWRTNDATAPKQFGRWPRIGLRSRNQLPQAAL